MIIYRIKKLEKGIHEAEVYPMVLYARCLLAAMTMRAKAPKCGAKTNRC
jgi:hypothetical protein